MQTVAMFGGSFDPPHLGHKAIVLEAISRLEIDILLIVPAYQNPLKNSSLATPKQRMAMCEVAFSDLGNVIISDYEMKQEIGYTSDSVKYFKDFYDLKYLIIGADNLKSLHLWHDFEWLNNNITWVIASRKDISTDICDTKMLKQFILISINENVSSSEIRSGAKREMIDEKISDKIETIYKGIK
jgi:nicotinate-nucleotide adenylyltransferase